jgi:hypothetical protein
LEIYFEKYASREHENIDTEYNSSDEDLVSHISQKQNLNLNELDVFLKTDRAPALNDILNWWKVSFKIKF